MSGLVYKGRVAGATVRVYAYASGVRGALLGQDTTTASGAFNNVAIADGYSGPLLVEAGFGGTYPEEAASATVTLELNERLRTVVPSYADGDAVSNLVLSPLTTFAVAYQESLQGSGRATVAARWGTARSAMETSFGVATGARWRRPRRHLPARARRAADRPGRRGDRQALGDRPSAVEARAGHRAGDEPGATRGAPAHAARVAPVPRGARRPPGAALAPACARRRRDAGPAEALFDGNRDHDRSQPRSYSNERALPLTAPGPGRPPRPRPACGRRDRRGRRPPPRSSSCGTGARGPRPPRRRRRGRGGAA